MFLVLVTENTYVIKIDVEVSRCVHGILVWRGKQLLYAF